MTNRHPNCEAADWQRYETVALGQSDELLRASIEEAAGLHGLEGEDGCIYVKSDRLKMRAPIGLAPRLLPIDSGGRPSLWTDVLSHALVRGVAEYRVTMIDGTQMAIRADDFWALVVSGTVDSDLRHK